MEGAQAAADAGGRTGKQQTLTDGERVLGPGRATPTSSRRVEAVPVIDERKANNRWAAAKLAGVGHGRRLRPTDDHNGGCIGRLDQLHDDHVRAVDLAGSQHPRV